MSYYVALFGAPVDLRGLQDVRTIPDHAVPDIARGVLCELSALFGLTNPRFVVDETGDTAHELVAEAWGQFGGLAALAVTRLGQLLRRAENSGAWTAVWDAPCDEPIAWPAPSTMSYTQARELLAAEANGEWIVEGFLCVPDGTANVSKHGPA